MVALYLRWKYIKMSVAFYIEHLKTHSPVSTLCEPMWNWIFGCGDPKQTQCSVRATVCAFIPNTQLQMHICESDANNSNRIEQESVLTFIIIIIIFVVIFGFSKASFTSSSSSSAYIQRGKKKNKRAIAAAKRLNRGR